VVGKKGVARRIPQLLERTAASISTKIQGGRIHGSCHSRRGLRGGYRTPMNTHFTRVWHGPTRGCTGQSYGTEHI